MEELIASRRRKETFYCAFKEDEESKDTEKFMIHKFKNVKEISQQALLLEHRFNANKNKKIEYSVDEFGQVAWKGLPQEVQAYLKIRF